MKAITKTKWFTSMALVLCLPTAFFIITSLLKYNLGIDDPFDAAQPFLESMGSKESLGWNINLLILFGPLIALAICANQVLQIRMYTKEERYVGQVFVQKRMFSLWVALFSIGLLATLFLYAFVENYRHP